MYYLSSQDKNENTIWIKTITIHIFFKYNYEIHKKTIYFDKMSGVMENLH